MASLALESGPRMVITFEKLVIATGAGILAGIGIACFCAFVWLGRVLRPGSK